MNLNMSSIDRLAMSLLVVLIAFGIMTPAWTADCLDTESSQADCICNSPYEGDPDTPDTGCVCDPPVGNVGTCEVTEENGCEGVHWTTAYDGICVDAGDDEGGQCREEVGTTNITINEVESICDNGTEFSSSCFKVIEEGQEEFDCYCTYRDKDGGSTDVKEVSLCTAL